MANETNLPPEKIKEILEGLGYKLVDRGRYWQSNAAFRNGDNGTALQIWKDSGVWRDFVSNSAPLPFSKLLQTHLGTNDNKILSKYFSDSYSPPKAESTQSDRLTMEKVYEESLLEDLFPHYSFYKHKGISDDTLKFLKGGLATKGHMYQRFVFPIYNEHGQIHGFSGRDMSSRENVPKWKHLGRKTKWLYPYYIKGDKGFIVQDAIETKRSVIIVESIGDLLNLFEHGFHNVLVSFGLDISPKLLCHLTSLDVDRIIISFNNDSNKSTNRGARASVKNYLKLLNHFDFDQLSICLPTKNDFGEMEGDDFELWSSKCKNTIKENAKSILSFAQKMVDSKDLPASLSKNIKILKSHVE